MARWLRIHQYRGHKFDSWSRVAKQLSLCTTTTEPKHLDPVLCKKRSHRHEKPADCN